MLIDSDHLVYRIWQFFYIYQAKYNTAYFLYKIKSNIKMATFLITRYKKFDLLISV